MDKNKKHFYQTFFLVSTALFLFSCRAPQVDYSGTLPTPQQPGKGPMLPGFQSAASKIIPAVVSIETLSKKRSWFGESFILPSGAGSGVILTSDGIIITNNHVIADADIVRVHVSGAIDEKARKKELEARVLGRDISSDIAVLKVDAKNLIPAKIGISKELQVGEWVLAVGNPLGFDNSLSVGVVSNLKRTLPSKGAVLVDAIQTDASITNGNSGGALANSRGEVIGINTAIATQTGGAEGIGFAIPIDRAMKIANDLIKHGKVQYGWDGLSFYPTEIFQIRSNINRLEHIIGAKIPRIGLVVKNVDPSSPAAKMGIKQFDIIMKIDDKDMNQATEYTTIMMDKKPGDTVRFQLWSKGKTSDIKLTLTHASKGQEI